MRVVPGLSFFLTLLALILCSSSFAQEAKPKKKIKDFGSSLERLQWDPQKQAAVEVTPASTRKGEEDDVIRIDTTLVTSAVLVLDKQGRSVQGLTAGDFVVSEEGEPQKVSHFLLGDNPNVARSIVLIIDYSGSQLPYIKNSVEAAKILVDKLNPLDRMAIVTDDVELILDFTHDKKQLKKKLDSLVEKITGDGGFLSRRRWQSGRSDQYSALMATLNEAFDDEDQRPIIVFQTDGDEAYRLRNPIITAALPPDLPPELRERAEENLQKLLQEAELKRKSFSIDDVYNTAEKSRATIYTVIPGRPFVGLTPEQKIVQAKADREDRLQASLSRLSTDRRKDFEARRKALADRMPAISPANHLFFAEQYEKLQTALAKVATLTGGWTEYLEEPGQADRIYSRIFVDINQRYILGYYPTNKAFNGNRRKIKIEVRGHPDYQIMGRKTYYRPGASSH